MSRFASALLIVLLSACDPSRGSAPDTGSSDAHPMRDAQVRIDDSSGKPICAEETAYPGVAGDSTCSLQAPAPDASAVDFGKVNLTLRIGGARVLVFIYVADPAACGDRQAWHYDDASDPSHIVLCPQACSLATSDPDSQLQVVVGCDSRCVQSDAGCAAPRL